MTQLKEDAVLLIASSSSTSEQRIGANYLHRSVPETSFIFLLLEGGRKVSDVDV